MGKGVKHNSENMKGVKHNSENMKGVKHNGKNKHYIDELEKFELINITNDDEFRAKAYAAGLPKSKVCRLLKYKKEIENNGIYKESQC